MAPFRLTYCGNVHKAGDLETWLEVVEGPVSAVAARQPQPFGLGVWWPAETAAAIARDRGALARVRAVLDQHGLSIWTLNAFPIGAFHAETVKTSVYQPDWSTEERLQYTIVCAEAVAALAPGGAVVPISTLPLGYRPPGAEPADLRLMARNLMRCVSHLVSLEERTGVQVALALEPEPFCLLETVLETADFLEQWLFDEGAWTVPEALLRRHLGVCIDLCHLAVVGEDPVAALSQLGSRGITVPKVQVSSCLELRQASAFDRLLTFEEPRYLHQTVAANGLRALDLGEVRRRRGEFQQGGRLRTHFHMPIDWDEPGAFGSTQQQVLTFLAALPTTDGPLLEVETYTWHVLRDLKPGQSGLIEGLCAELDFVRRHLPSDRP